MGISSRLQESHLTDEQLSELLLGINPPQVRDHLADCESCSREAGEFSAAVNAFEQQSRLWAENRYAKLPYASPKRQRAFLSLHHPYSWAGAVLALLVAYAMGVSLERSHVHPVESPVAVAQSSPKVSPTILQADNQLLGTINGELRSEDAANAPLYGLNTDSRSRHRNARKAVDE